MENNAFDSLYITIVHDPRDWWEKEDSERLKLMHETFVKYAKENNTKYYEE